ncbi:MAG: GNAT family N-acetyltransferase [Clostridium paraputrificum]
MVDIDFEFKDYIVSSVEEDGLEELNNWIKINNSEDHTYYSLDSQMFYRRFLEYYVTENEFFLEIYKNNELVGVFKGRLELENKKELFIWLFIIKKELRNEGYGSEIVEGVIEYFMRLYTIDTIKVGVVQNNLEGISFWNSKGFKVERMTKDFFQDEEENGRNLVIMQRQ